MQHSRPARPVCAVRCLSLATAAAAALVGCGSPTVELMPTPIAYVDTGIDPYAHLDPQEQTTTVQVFYGTDREPSGFGSLGYGNTLSPLLRLGSAAVRFGKERDGWEELREASLVSGHGGRTKLTLEQVSELQTVEPGTAPADDGSAFAEAIDAALAQTRDREIVIYVHGAKVNFSNGCAFAAELAHFGGRDFLPMAFCWPTHQNIFTYVSGTDVARGITSADYFESLLHLLAERTRARRIHVICWSAGGIVTTRALVALRERYADLDHSALRERLRLGVVTFAAIDVEIDEFMDELPAIHDLCDRVIVTMTDHDTALITSVKLRGGGARVGMATEEVIASEIEAAGALPRLEVINVSHAQDERHFDIAGHRYWFHHPWVSSDMVLLLRTGLPAERRGLESAARGHVWYFPPDYPGRVEEAFQRELGPAW